MESWIRFSLKNVGVVFLAMIFIFVGGIYSIKTMKMEQMPNVDIPYLVIQIPYAGATPDQGLEDIGKPLETALSNIQKLDNLYIQSHSDSVVAILGFDMDQKLDEAEKDVTSAVASLKLPDGAGKPAIIKDGPSQMPIFTFAISSENAKQADISQYVNERIKTTLSTVEDIGKVDVSGETEKQLSIKLDTEKMKEKNITYDVVKQALLAHNFSFPAGQVNINEKTLNVQADYKLKSLTDVKNVEMMVPGPTEVQTVKLSDVATVEFGSKTETIYTRLKDTPAVLVSVKAQPGANAVEVVKQINQKLSDLQLPDGYKLTKLYDSSKQVEKSVNSMLKEVLLGTLFAVIVTFVFLRNVRATIVAVLSIPLSVLAAMITMKYLQYSLNMMTLAGIAVAVGRVIDDSIVVIENIYRRTLNSKQRDEGMVLTAAKEVGGAVTSSTITTMAVFGPLSFVPGIIGKFFAPFGITVIVALAFSLLVSLTVVPLFAKLFLLRLKHKEPQETMLQRAYQLMLSWAMQKKVITLIFAFVVFSSSLVLVPMIPKNFLPEEKAVSYNLTTDLPVGTSLHKANSVAKDMESILSKQVSIKSYQTNVSGEKVGLSIDLKDSVTKEEVTTFEKDIKEKMGSLGTDIETTLTPISITGGGGQFALIVEGGNTRDLENAGNKIVENIKDIKGLSNVKTNLSAVKPQLNLAIDEEKAAEKGLNPMMVAAFVRGIISGENITAVQLDGKTTSVNVSLKSDNLTSIESITSQQIMSPLGQQVKLSDVATLSEEPGPSALNRLNQQEYVQVSARFTTDNVSGVQAEIDKRLKTLDLPKGVKYRSEGQSQAMNEGFQNMIVAMGIAVVLVFMVMLVTFGNIMAPFAILFSLPFLFTGGLLGLYMTNEPLGMPALVGFLMLIGIVVTNAIVLMDRVIQNEKKGMAIKEAILEAGATRLRPILMTALATIGALMPLALSTDGGLISRSLAIVVISGLMASTLLTLIIVPTAYYVMYRIKWKFTKKKAVLKVEESA
ncbi:MULTISPECIES: efflux RND transporter permease subunit [Bacillus cereus group]|uniref:Efflux RND transporter permease subunit n=1 Tax=Bacillus cereus TaxID=1396 RepID=A0AAN6B6B0_BACCE|nr:MULTISPECIES: efflux RND transporter permease subunit [Bacillus cereus group]KAB2447923.1 efflux RND transporter permease subunit [Bacillus cereus]KAB2484508.1 efflux RND transporter permease subunit [Bacillus cereus]MCU4957139.1 efflux RND transporter permease subunit [Bacillus cereus]PHG45633.1 acriflavin resistance protein [Bacillus wiedmannii]